jgi:hypothetical protein
MGSSVNAPLDRAHGVPFDNFVRFLGTTIAHFWELLTMESKKVPVSQTNAVHVSSRFG